MTWTPWCPSLVDVPASPVGSDCQNPWSFCIQQFMTLGVRKDVAILLVKKHYTNVEDVHQVQLKKSSAIDFYEEQFQVSVVCGLGCGFFQAWLLQMLGKQIEYAKQAIHWTSLCLWPEFCRHVISCGHLFSWLWSRDFFLGLTQIVFACMYG